MPTISELALELYKKAIAEEKNEDIYRAGLRESETFSAFMDIFNYYRSFYKDDSLYIHLYWIIMKGETIFPFFMSSIHKFFF